MIGENFPPQNKTQMTDKKITIGSATYDDFEGVYFTYMAIRLSCMDQLDELDLVIIDNNPESAEGKATADFCSKANIRYFKEPIPRSTAIRDKIFRVAEAPFCVSIDPHVLFEPNTIKRLIEFSQTDEAKTNDLFHGAMLYDYLDPKGELSTHLKKEWRDNMFGTWACDIRANDPEGEPFEIEMQGLGLFGCKTDAWAGFSPLFQGFGGEEGYIHEKFHQRGDRTMLLPWLRWVHRFQRPRGSAYPLILEERIRNYCFGWLELDIPLDDIIEHFGGLHPNLPVEQIADQAKKLFAEYQENPDQVLLKIHSNPKSQKQTEIEKVNAEPIRQTWHDTQVNLGQPLELDVLGKKLMISSFSLKWAND